MCTKASILHRLSYINVVWPCFGPVLSVVHVGYLYPIDFSLRAPSEPFWPYFHTYFDFMHCTNCVCIELIFCRSWWRQNLWLKILRDVWALNLSDQKRRAIGIVPSSNQAALSRLKGRCIWWFFWASIWHFLNMFSWEAHLDKGETWMKSLWDTSMIFSYQPMMAHMRGMCVVGKFRF